jgi:hypothetical protein
MTTKVPPFLTWHICEIVVDCFSLVAIAYVLNQYKGHWSLSDALHSAISMNLKLRITKKCTIFLDLNGKGFWCHT